MEAAADDCTEAPPEYLDARARRYYRAVLQYFRRQPIKVATVDDLVTYMRNWEQINADETEIAIRLHHATLPRLDAAGCIDYDVEGNTATYRGDSPAYR